MGQDGVTTAKLPTDPPSYNAAAFAGGLWAACRSILTYVLAAGYIGFGALAHDLGFSLTWAVVSVPLIWAGPAQIILVTTLGAGSLIQTAIAVWLSSIRLFPMVVSLLPLVKTPATRLHHLIVPAHFTAISMWVESLRLLPTIARENRILFCSGIGIGMVCFGMVATVIGYFLAAKLPPLFGAAVLFLTPMSFMIALARNAKQLVDQLAFGLGLVLAPLFAAAEVRLHLLFAGLAAGTVAYLAHRLRGATR
jgi:predicted branched-subunit amino acid permease